MYVLAVMTILKPLLSQKISYSLKIFSDFKLPSKGKYADLKANQTRYHLINNAFFCLFFYSWRFP